MSGQVLALAGVFQAAELVRQAANHGTWSGYAAEPLMDSLFRLEADSPLAVYGGKDHLHLGLETLLGVLNGDREHSETLQVAVGLLQLQSPFRRNQAMQEKVGEALESIAKIEPEAPEYERRDEQARRIARLYQETISHLAPRIVVHGKPNYLQNSHIVNWIRTLLFAGLRSAVLWGQLGGGRFSLLFGRRRMLAETARIMEG